MAEVGLGLDTGAAKRKGAPQRAPLARGHRMRPLTRTATKPVAEGGGT